MPVAVVGVLDALDLEDQRRRGRAEQRPHGAVAVTVQPDRGRDRAAQQLELVAVGDEQVGRREADPKHREVTVTEPVQSPQEPQVRRFVGVAERVGAARRCRAGSS